MSTSANQFKDELSDLVPNATPAKTAHTNDDIPTTPPATGGNPPAAAAANAAASNEIVGEEVEWGDQEMMKKGDGMDRIRPAPKSDKAVRFALLDLPIPPGASKKYWVRAVRTHWVLRTDGTGKKDQYICLATPEGQGICCTKLAEDGRYHVIAPAVEYTNADPKSGVYPKGYTGPIEVKVGFVDLSRANFRSLSTLPEEGTSIYDYDFVMALNGNKYEFGVKSRKPRWRLNADAAAAVQEAVKKMFLIDNGQKLFKRLGKPISLIQWKALLSGAAPTAKEATLNDVEDLD